MLEANTVLEERQEELEEKQEEIASQAESLLKTNEELKKLSVATSETSNAISIFDNHGNLEWFNKACIKIYGYEFEEFVQLKGINILENSNNPNISDYLNQCLVDKKNVIYETETRNKYGEIFWIQTTLSPVLDEKGNVDKIISIDADITDLKKAEFEIMQRGEEIQAQNEKIVLQNEELEKHRNNLEELVKKRTRELEKAKEKAEEANRLKTSFLSNMSHEIRTPMNAIVGFSAILKGTECTNEERNLCIEQINTNSEVLLNLINDIVDLSKIQSNQLDLNYCKVEVNSLLDEIFETYNSSRFIENKTRISLVCNKFSAADIWINTDKTRLKQILSNLLNNALKFTTLGVVEFGYKIGNKDYIEFFVSDTGIGIPREKLDIIFARFTKIEDDKTSIYRGAGLGLAIAHNLVLLLKGKMWVKSEINKGSTFYFTLPYDLTIKDTLVKKQNDQIELDLSKYAWDKFTILIAEDEETNFLFLKTLLVKTGIRVLWAKNGVEAVSFFKDNYTRVNLVLMDIKMPEMNGIQALSHIREINQEIKVVAQTAFAMNNEIEEIKRNGFNDYIVKPIRLRELLSIISKYLE